MGEIEENGRKMGEEWEKKPIFHGPISPFFRRSKTFPTVNNQVTALTDGKLGNFSIPRHSAPQRLVRMAVKQSSRARRGFMSLRHRGLATNALGCTALRTVRKAPVGLHFVVHTIRPFRWEWHGQTEGML